MRFENKFNYSIHISEEINGDYDEIPPMLIQPYLENAILYSTNPKEAKGHVKVEIGIVSAIIKISIIDNGIGHEKSIELSSKQVIGRYKSLRMKITKDRVRMLNTIQQSNLNVEIIDLYNGSNVAIGTQVDLLIPFVNNN